MIRVGVQFLAGRFHATPWGRHVNEGAVEWPPSPWRILRALVATGFSKLGWVSMPEPAGAAICALGQRLPVFYLPRAGAAHTRHYMPLYKSKTTKVLDTFAVPGRDARLLIEWDVPLEPAQVEVLDALLRHMSYLGRAESWIEAERIDGEPEEALRPCYPLGHALADESGDDVEAVELLAVRTPADYRGWREQMFERERTRRLAAKQEAARRQGKREPAQLSKKDRDALDEELPLSWLDALCADTAALRKARWSEPPGSRWVTYLRTRDRLDTEPGPKARQLRRKVDTALLALVPETRGARHLPLMRDALARCEMLHDALVSASKNVRSDDVPSAVLSGVEDGQRMLGHGHATLIPLQLDERGGGGRRVINHIAVYARKGFDDGDVAALRQVRKTYAKGHAGIFVSLMGVGSRDEFAAQVPQFAKSKVWQSSTPFVPPRFLKRAGKNGLFGRVRDELRSRGLGTELVRVEFEVDEDDYLDEEEFWPVWRRRRGYVELRGSVSVDSAASVAGRYDGRRVPVLARRWRHFRRVRRGKRERPVSRPPVVMALGLRLTFAEPVRGPISLGYASHFGLGSFRPAVG